ncbi:MULTISPECIES: peptidoglycan recognition protein family protein [unclassified Streptomyces]|uniref:peptidoglycan recognition protein family protein n=1 Tax=unclassified Streptomyces TaxID=2593676 RepID=UPI002DD8DDFA|nr:peptidoglycan recognition protein [Streptomyces sp. NBC_01237]WRZ72809.1 peptidoglycan recognition protein [Streptomyces sp. NBC_01237]
MRTLLATSIGVTCAAALTLPLAVPASSTSTSATFSSARAPASVEPAAELPGSTQSLPLSPLAPASTRATGAPTTGAAQGLPRRDARPFSLVGVVWDDADAELHGTVQIRTRATGTTTWSGWQDIETHNTEHAADEGSAEREAGKVRGSTAPLWVGDSDGVEVRVNQEPADPRNRAATSVALPGGLRLELVDPGADPRQPVAGRARSAARTASVIPALTQEDSAREAVVAAGAKPYIGPRPRIITRKGWGANEKLRERRFVYTKKVKAAFVHHSATGNNYRCSQAPAVLRSIYRYHVKSSGWRDFGYNFAVDKCGNIYEGRAGGVTKAVLGAHTLGFNTNSMGVVVLGTFTSKNPPAAAVNSIAKLTAWKLGLFGANPKGKTTLVSGGSNKYKKGKKVKLNVISGHRDGFATECPGKRLYKKLGTARTTSARLQGR